MKSEMEELKENTASLLLEWARKLAPYYGPSGSMDLDLAQFRNPAGPSTYNQFAHYAFLLLSEGIVPGAAEVEASNFRTLALKNIDYNLRVTGEDFHTPHYSRGRDWGNICMEWTPYFLLRSAMIIHDHQLGTPSSRSRLNDVILGSSEVIFQRHDDLVKQEGWPGMPFMGNHFSWCMLLLYEVGKFYRRPAMEALGRRGFVEHILPCQSPGTGAWHESGGIVVNYGMVTAQAVALYAETADDPLAREAVARSLPFFQATNFPDGTSSVASDCRMRYHGKPFLFLPPTFLRCDGGEAFCLSRVQAMRRSLVDTEPQDNAAQALGFYAAFAEYGCGHAARRGKSRVIVAPRPVDLPLARVEDGKWVGFLAAQLVAESPSRFCLDSQNLIELWSARAGYLIGGGGSKYNPRFSTIRRTTGSRGYVPTSAAIVESTPRRAVCRYDFDGDPFQVVLKLEENRASLEFECLRQANPLDRYEVGLSLMLREGETVFFPGLALSKTILSDVCVDIVLEEAPAAFQWRSISVSVPPGSRFFYPVIPFSSYHQDTLPAAEDYVAVLSFPLAGGGAKVELEES